MAGRRSCRSSRGWPRRSTTSSAGSPSDRRVGRGAVQRVAGDRVDQARERPPPPAGCGRTAAPAGAGAARSAAGGSSMTSSPNSRRSTSIGRGAWSPPGRAHPPQRRFDGQADCQQRVRRQVRLDARGGVQVGRLRVGGHGVGLVEGRTGAQSGTRRPSAAPSPRRSSPPDRPGWRRTPGTRPSPPPV